MKLLLKTQAVSWKTRRVKIAGQWADVSPVINLLKIRVGEEQYMEIEMNLNGQKSIERVY